MGNMRLLMYKNFNNFFKVKLDKMLESKDSAVHNVLQTQGIKMPYFAFR